MQPHRYVPELDPQMAGDCSICGNRRLHQIHDVPVRSISDLHERLRETFGRTPFIRDAERIATELHRRFRTGASMVRVGEILLNDRDEEEIKRVLPALVALSSASFAVVDLIGLGPYGEPIASGEMSDRIRTGRQAAETFLALVPRAGFLAMSPA